MPQLIQRPAIIPPPGRNPKLIQEYVGRVATGKAAISIARIVCPPGWIEVGQRPEFTETKVVLKGMLKVEHEQGVMEVQSGQAILSSPGEWIRYSTPDAEGAEYIAICMPAFSPQTVHRDPE
jgi:mannose-6-phosphate isomerase-like protein (cupin superfamily)